MNPIFLGTIKQGKLLLNTQDQFDKYLLTLEGQEIQVVVGKVKKQRSSQENKYYWAVPIKLLSEATGYTDEEMHDALRMLFLKDMSKKIPTLRSTASLTTVEMEEYLSKIRVWASQVLNCYVPEPNEVSID